MYLIFCGWRLFVDTETWGNGCHSHPLQLFRNGKKRETITFSIHSNYYIVECIFQWEFSLMIVYCEFLDLILEHQYTSCIDWDSGNQSLMDCLIAVWTQLLCRIKITGLLPEDAEYTPVVSSAPSTPDLTVKPGNCELICIIHYKFGNAEELCFPMPCFSLVDDVNTVKAVLWCCAFVNLGRIHGTWKLLWWTSE